MQEINFSEEFLPGIADNFVSNEIYTKNIGVKDIFRHLITPCSWVNFYNKISDISLYEGRETLRLDSEFHFQTFNFSVEAKVLEFEDEDDVAKLSWFGSTNFKRDDQLRVYCGWIIEKCSKERVRILFQETQNGLFAKDFALQKPSELLLAHQEWVEGLIYYAHLNK